MFHVLLRRSLLTGTSVRRREFSHSTREECHSSRLQGYSLLDNSEFSRTVDLFRRNGVLRQSTIFLGSLYSSEYETFTSLEISESMEPKPWGIMYRLFYCRLLGCTRRLRDGSQDPRPKAIVITSFTLGDGTIRLTSLAHITRPNFPS